MIGGDSAFFHPIFQKWYQTENIKQLPTGAKTPWPNRAETAVRLFKKQYILLSGYAKEDPLANTATIQQLVKMAAWARNNQLTISGKTAIEMAFGRRPPDLLDLEGQNPEQLTNDPLEEDKLDRIVRKLALKAHLEARQADDLRGDLARNIKPSDGPYSVGERVFYWDLDPAKFSKGTWKRGKVVAIQGPMVTIETTTNGIQRLNESKLRRDHDQWHDVPLPLTLEQEGVMLNPARDPPPAQPPPAQGEKE